MIMVCQLSPGSFQGSAGRQECSQAVRALPRCYFPWELSQAAAFLGEVRASQASWMISVNSRIESSPVWLRPRGTARRPLGGGQVLSRAERSLTRQGRRPKATS